MKKIKTTTLLILLILSLKVDVFAGTINYNISKIKIELAGKIYSGTFLYTFFGKKISKKFNGDNEQILKEYQRIVLRIDNILLSKELRNKNEYLFKNIEKIIKYLVL